MITVGDGREGGMELGSVLAASRTKHCGVAAIRFREPALPWKLRGGGGHGVRGTVGRARGQELPNKSTGTGAFNFAVNSDPDADLTVYTSIKRSTMCVDGHV